MLSSCFSKRFCASDARQSLRDPSAKPLTVAGETASAGRPMGPWHEPKALQICFAHFAKNVAARL